MADKRMFNKAIIDSDAFLDLPVSAQALYFHLAMRSDDDGFNNKPRAIMNMIGAKDDDMRILIQKKFVLVFETSGVIVIKHWRLHNTIRKDCYNETKYKFEKSTLYLDENGAWSQTKQERNETVTDTLRDRNEPETQIRIDKIRIDKNREDKERKESSAVCLSENNNSLKWESLARTMIRLGDIDQAKAYCEKSSSEGFPIDFEKLKDEETKEG